MGSGPASVPFLGLERYRADSYDLFIRGQLDLQPADKELRKFLEWKKKN